MNKFVINVKQDTTIEDIIFKFNKINDKSECYSLNLILYKFINPEVLAVIVALYKYKLIQNYNVKIDIDGQNQYAERVNFHMHMGQKRIETFLRHNNDGRFIEITNFDEGNSIGIVNNIMRIFRENLELENGLEDSVFGMLNYCFFEIVDNVHTHSKSEIGGYLIAQRFPKEGRLSITVIDCGKGIYSSLTESEKSKYKHLNEDEAIRYCIRELVTDGEGQGNGLYHTKKFVESNDGKLYIYSGNKKLIIKKDILDTKDIHRFNGTIVHVELNMNNRIELKDIFGDNEIPTTVKDVYDSIDCLW